MKIGDVVKLSSGVFSVDNIWFEGGLGVIDTIYKPTLEYHSDSGVKPLPDDFRQYLVIPYGSGKFYHQLSNYVIERRFDYIHREKSSVYIEGLAENQDILDELDLKWVDGTLKEVLIHRYK